MPENKQARDAEASVEKLLSERGWHKFHQPGFIVPALSVECGELLDLCLWKTPEEINLMFRDKKKELEGEIADIAINLISLIKYLDLDLDSIVSQKVEELLKRYDCLEYGTHKPDKINSE